MAISLIAYDYFLIPHKTTSEASRLDQWEQLSVDKNSITRNLLRSHSPLVQTATGKIILNKEKQQGILRFIGLPALKKGQVYVLWQFNLKAKLNEPIVLAKFDGNKSKQLDIGFKATALDKEPFKFLVTAEEGNKSLIQPTIAKSLFIAQP